jgi:predicted acyltransferase
MDAGSPPTLERIDALDQFRGYTVLGMFVVNFVGGFAAAHWLLKHHNTFCSYADTIMPQFFFAVGFFFRLTMVRRTMQFGSGPALQRVFYRIAGLLLISLVLYTVDRPAQRWSDLVELGVWGAIRGPLKCDFFQTLTHIAVTSLWVLPVIRASATVRVLFLLVSAGLHVGLSHWFYFAWVNNGNPNGIDGGPLGFLTWTIPVLVGSLCADPYLRGGGRLRRGSLIGWAAVLMALGYLLSCGTRFYDVAPELRESEGISKLAAQPVIPDREALERAWSEFRGGDWGRLLCEPPFVPPPHPPGDIGASPRFRQWNYWMMSQQAGTLSYQVFSAGFSMAVLWLAYLCCDRLGWRLGILRTLGSNALAAYVLHMMVANAIHRFMPSDAPAWYMWSGCGLFLVITWLFVRSLQRSGIHLRL